MAVTPHFKRGDTLSMVYAKSRELFPTDMSSAELRELDATLKRRSVFSARTTNAQYVQTIAEVTDLLLSGKINEATGRMYLQEAANLLGYDPAHGFPGDDPTRIPPAELGSLRDLASEQRAQLVLNTQERICANYAFARAGDTADARYQFPAYELVRIYLRANERDDWQARFVSAGGKLIDGRMIALKGSAVWEALGIGEGGYRDTLGNAYPPFAFGSGMGWREVERAECISLGLISADEELPATDPELSDELTINREAFDDEFLSALEDDLLAA